VRRATGITLATGGFRLCGRGGRCGLVDLAEHFVHLHDVAFVLRAALQHAGLQRRHLDRDLVGVQLDDGLTRGHGFTLLLAPAGDRGFDDRFAEWWNLERDHY